MNSRFKVIRPLYNYFRLSPPVSSLRTINIFSQNKESGLNSVIEDNGTGISVEDKNKILPRGFGKQTGLVLFLSREIMAVTGMTIFERGITGKGARFEVLVPKEHSGLPRNN
jgi:signal transduction histidine kinase